MPFWLHHLLEYLLAAALVAMSVHLAHGALLGAAGVAFALLALTARGPLGVLRLCGRRLHRGLDVVVALCLAAAPAAPALRPDAAGIVTAEVAALAWLRLATLTDVGAARSSDAPSAPEEDAPGLRSAQRAGAARRRVDAGARLAGDVAGRLHVAWRRARR